MNDASKAQFERIAKEGHRHYEANTDFAYLWEPLVAENTFLTKEKDAAPLPTYEESVPLLPELVWEGRPEAVACYHTAWKIAFGNLRSPQDYDGMVSNFIDTAFNDHLFMWDSSFITMFGKYGVHAFNFQRTLDNFYARQHMDGFICRELAEKVKGDQFHRFDPVSTGPNILAWTEWESFLVTGDTERIAAVFPPLLAYHLWLKQYRTWPDGTYWSTGWACGMDNQPRQQPGVSDTYHHGHMVWADTCIQQIISCQMLIRMAALIGREKDVQALREEEAALTDVVNRKLWNDEDAFYYDLWPNGEQNKVKSIGAYWALLAGIVPEHRLDAFIAHLENPKEFNRPHPIPSLSADHPLYDENGGYWRGGVWSPTNYMVLKGLEKYGYHRLAAEIAERHVRAVFNVYKATGTLWENYAPEHSKPGDPAKDHFVGWAGLSPIAMVIEYVFGIHSNTKDRIITWHIHRTDRHGVVRYPLGDACVDLICPARREGEKPLIEARSDIPLTLRVVWPDGETTVQDIMP